MARPFGPRHKQKHPPMVIQCETGVQDSHTCFSQSMLYCQLHFDTKEIICKKTLQKPLAIMASSHLASGTYEFTISALFWPLLASVTSGQCELMDFSTLANAASGQYKSLALANIPSTILEKIHVMPNMSGVVARLRWEFWRASGVISLAPNSAHHSRRFLGAQHLPPENLNTVTSSKSTTINHLHTIPSEHIASHHLITPILNI